MGQSTRGRSVAAPSDVDRWLGLGAIIGPVLFVLAFNLAGIIRPGYSPIDQAISDLGVGEYAWLVNGSLVILGLSLGGAATAFYRITRPIAGATFRFVAAALLACVGAGFAVAGIFDETNPLHWQLGAPLVYGGATFGLLLAGLILRRDDGWRRWGTVTVLASALTLALVALTFYTFSSYTFTEGDPSPNGQLGGLMERLLFLVILAWYAVFGWLLLRAQARLGISSSVGAGEAGHAS
jgi:hypothetical membrane protein